MYVEITNKLAVDILQQKIEACNEKIKNLPIFLADDLIAERRLYELHLMKLQGGGVNGL